MSRRMSLTDRAAILSRFEDEVESISRLELRKRVPVMSRWRTALSNLDHLSSSHMTPIR